jgi:signal transduction histidine kinase
MIFYQSKEMGSHVKRSLIMIFVAVIFLLPRIASVSADSRVTKRVLILYSLDKDNKGQNRFCDQLEEVFNRDKTWHIKIYNEYLDLIRFQVLENTAAVNDYLRRKYSREKPDVVITVLPPAFDSLELNGNELFKGTPIIAAFIPRVKAESLEHSPLHNRVKGIVYADNVYEIVQSALKLRPATKHVAFIAGTSALDKSFAVPILGEIKRAARGQDLIDLSQLTMGETLSRVHHLPPDTVVFITSVFRDKEGVNFYAHDALKLVSNASNAPVFGFVETHIGMGIVGGRLASVQWQVEKVAELTHRILAGESPSAIPVVLEAGYHTVYDWRELKRWGISANSFPKGSTLINQEVTLFARYRMYFIAALVFLILQMFLIAFLIHLNRTQKKTSVQLRDYEERYRELLRIDRSSRLGELTASLAHELNQPLQAILSNAQAALRFLTSGKNDPELSREILQNIVQDDKRAADVIRSLRSMVKKGEIKKEPINVNDVVHEVISIIKGESISQNIVIETLLDEAAPSITADRTQIQQVLLNLITNAMDAVGHGAFHMKKIVLQTERRDSFVRIAVHDYGPGIPGERIDGVFEPFYTTKTNGLGMGLAVCRSIIKNHGGRIWAENNPEGGATFFFELQAAGHD